MRVVLERVEAREITGLVEDVVDMEGLVRVAGAGVGVAAEEVVAVDAEVAGVGGADVVAAEEDKGGIVSYP